MNVVEMLGQLGQLLNDPNEGRYSAFVKLVRLNIAQQELMSTVPPSELAKLVVYNYKLVQGPERPPGNPYDLPLPLDFFKEVSPESVAGEKTGPFRILPPDEFPTFPFDGSAAEPVVKITGRKILAFGRPFDQTVYITYYRWPKSMKMTGVENGYKAGSGSDLGKTIKEAAWTGSNVDSELLETSHMAILNQAYRSLLISDQEVKEVAAGK